MTPKEIEYYAKMAKRDRIFSFRKDGKFYGLITFLVGNSDNKFVRDDPWSIVEDENNGQIVYIDQFLSNRDNTDMKSRVTFWNELKTYLKLRFSDARCIKWNRYRDGKVHKHTQTL